MEIKNLKKAAARLKKAIKKGENIILYGDADLDGVTSVVIIQETLKTLGGKIRAVYFPDRENEGYGITKKALSKLRAFAPALLVAFDLGITNFKEIELAKKIGFEVIIIDHHEIIKKLPRASIIVNPEQKGDKYPFKMFAACGLSLRLAERLLGKVVSPGLRKSLLELAALGTIADMVPREKDNLEIIEAGLNGIDKSWRPGIRVFFRTEEIAQRKDLSSKIGYIISVLNVRDVKEGLPASYRLFVSQTEDAAQNILKELQELHLIRQNKIQEIVRNVEQEISLGQERPLIFEGSPDFDYVLLGAAASIIANKYDKPVFLYKKKPKESLGSARSPSRFNTVKAMEYCSDLLLAFGGHPPASGFRLQTEKLSKFEQCLIEYFSK